MTQDAAAPDIYIPGTHQIDPHRLAWGVLLIAFAIFCVIAAAVIIGIDYFLFQSTVPLRSILNSGRGTVGIMELANPIPQVGQNGALLPKGIVVSTDPQSQGTLQFVDSEGADTFIASVTLHNNSVLTLREASRPRFDWSRTRHNIDLINVRGKVSVDIAEIPGLDVLVRVETPAGAIIHLEGAGQYIITSMPSQLNVINREGRATFIPPDRRQGHSVPDDGLGIIYYDDNTVEQRSGYVDLLVDRKFRRLRTDGEGAAQQVWVCSNAPGDDPPGRYGFVSMQGLMPLHLVREDNATTHGETSCIQSFGQAGLDIQAAGLNHLALRATFHIQSHSLDACGTQGSECPLMLRMDYIDANGEGQRWYHGFYTREASPQSNFPQRCASCIQDHELINANAWYTYESPNLMTLLNTESTTPPISIVGIWFYASGHQYDVRIDEVALLGARLDIVDSTAGDSSVPPA